MPCGLGCLSLHGPSCALVLVRLGCGPVGLSVGLVLCLVVGLGLVQVLGLVVDLGLVYLDVWHDLASLGVLVSLSVLVWSPASASYLSLGSVS